MKKFEFQLLINNFKDCQKGPLQKLNNKFQICQKWSKNFKRESKRR